MSCDTVTYSNLKPKPRPKQKKITLPLCSLVIVLNMSSLIGMIGLRWKLQSKSNKCKSIYKICSYICAIKMNHIATNQSNLTCFFVYLVDIWVRNE